MDSFGMHGRSSWVLRVFGRNPLVRSSDRLEAAVIFVAALAVIVMLPIACAVGTAVHESQVLAAAEITATRHQVTAVVTADSVGLSEPYVVGTQTPVRWMVGNDERTAVVQSREWRKAGESMDIWVDEQGVRTPTPPSSTDQTMVAVFAALLAWSTGLAAGAAMILIVRTWLNHRRYAAWEAEYQDLAGDGGTRRQQR